MESLDAILTRRSIRKYAEGSIPPETVEKLLRAAMSAPSAGNQQPWHFIVVDDRGVLNAVADMHPNAGMSREAALGILVSGEPVHERFRDYWPQDCAAATQNILIAAHSLGLGAVWTGIYPRQERVEKFREFFSMPEGVIPFAFIPLGTPAETKPPSDRYSRDRVHDNSW